MSDIHNGIDIEQITVSLGADCAASRKHAMELVEEQEQIPFAKKAPRIPRNTEPCPLWVAGLIAVGVGGGALLGTAALVWVAYQVVIRIGGVL